MPVAASPLPAARRVLVLAPHADDEVFGCGGAIMRHADRGVPVRVVVAADGGHGVSDENLAAGLEQHAAARPSCYRRGIHVAE